jgi:hypothetical protein
MRDTHSPGNALKSSRRGQTGFTAVDASDRLSDLHHAPSKRRGIESLSAREALGRAAERQISDEEYEAIRDKGGGTGSGADLTRVGSPAHHQASADRWHKDENRICGYCIQAKGLQCSRSQQQDSQALI